MDEYVEFREDKEPYRRINVDSLLNTEQRKQAELLLSCLNHLVEDYGGIDDLKIEDSDVGNPDNWILLLSDCHAFGESQHPD